MLIFNVIQTWTLEALQKMLSWLNDFLKLALFAAIVGKSTFVRGTPCSIDGWSTTISALLTWRPLLWTIFITSSSLLAITPSIVLEAWSPW
jgi:hypothetical protein